MKLLGFAVAAFGFFCAVVAFLTGHPSFYLIAAFALVASVATYRAAPISSYLRIFVGIFSTEIIIFGLNTLLNQTGYWPAMLSELAMPVSLPITAALFTILVYGVSFVPIVQRMMSIADRYFETTEKADIKVWPFNRIKTSEKAWATTMIVILVLINQVQVFLTILVSFVSRDLFNAIQAYNSGAFWHQLLVVFPILASPFIVSKVVEFLLQSALIIRWRRWLTEDYSARWLDGHNHYRMSLAGVGVDNPDQRISEDISRFIDGGQIGYGLYTFSVILISQLSSFVSFAILLWTLSANLSFPGTSLVIPGFLLWCALLYAVVGSVATHLIGKPLSRLSFARQHYEANFRFSLARLREYSEQVALLAGEHNEKASLIDRFKSVVTNYYSVVFVQARLMFFTSLFGQYSSFIPYAITAPFYFAKKIPLGIMQQVSRAFGEVNQALTFFISYYQQLAEYKSVLDRLTTFDKDLAHGESMTSFVRMPGTADAPSNLALQGVSLRLPSGEPIMQKLDLKLTKNESVLLTGPSGSGKSTLFRAVAGIWPYGDGFVQVPRDADILVLPQKPYLPIGTLRAAVAYPNAALDYAEVDIVAALRDVELDRFIERLDMDDNWTQIMSGGEQQRLAVARALLAKPDWLLLDEATAAMDPALEHRIYDIIAKRLPNTTVISNGHRATLTDLHARRMTMKPTTDGRFAPEDAKVAAE
jgi:putative ATP-binding cassette transporter